VTEIVILSVLFLVSLGVNALITRWSAKRVLGLDISVIKSGIVVLLRSLSALLAGFAVGYAIRLGSNGEMADKGIQVVGMGIVSLLSFLAYWVLLGRLTKSSITLWGMTKTVGTETALLIVAAVGIAVVVSTVTFIFKG